MYKRIINPEGKEFHYYEYGKNNPEAMLFLPGYADSALMYWKLGRSLAHEYRVIALDFPIIHGNNKIYNLERLTKYLASFVQELGLKKFTLAGFSACGLVAIDYTYYYPDKVKELVLLNSVPLFILSEGIRRFYLAIKPFLILRPMLFLYSRINSRKLFRKIFKLPRISRFTAERMRKYYYSAFGTQLNLVGESLIIKFKDIKVPKKIIFFKDDTVIPWGRYQDFVEKQNCRVVVFSEGLHADKKIYWEKLKSLWLKSPVIDFQEVKVEKEK